MSQIAKVIKQLGGDIIKYSDDQARDEHGRWITSTGEIQVKGERYRTTEHGAKRDAIRVANEAREHGHTVGVYQIKRPPSEYVQIGTGGRMGINPGGTTYEVRHKDG